MFVGTVLKDSCEHVHALLRVDSYCIQWIFMKRKSGASKASELKSGSIIVSHWRCPKWQLLGTKIARDTIYKGSGYIFSIFWKWVAPPVWGYGPLIAWRKQQSVSCWPERLVDKRLYTTTSSSSGLEGYKERSVVGSFHGKSLFRLIGNSSTKDWRNRCPNL